jgi:hypothetical protein
MLSHLPDASDDDKGILGDEGARLAHSAANLIKIIEMHDALVLWAANVSRDVQPEDFAELSTLGSVIPNGLFGPMLDAMLLEAQSLRRLKCRRTCERIPR